MSEHSRRQVSDKINWKLLREQKDWLLSQTDEPDLTMATGLIGLIDEIQDIAVDYEGIPSETVFGFAK